MGAVWGDDCATPSIGSCEQVTAHELLSFPAGLSAKVTDPAADVPFPVLLENALPSIGESRAQGIQSRFGGDGLPPAIKQLQGVIGDGGDQVPMQEDLGSVSLRVEGHASVTTGPVGVALDGSDHLGFDFAHGVVSFDLIEE